MTDFQIRNTISTDLARLSSLDHTVQTHYVWQLDLHRETGQVDVLFREVRLPRQVQVEYPRKPADLPDTWHLTSMFTALMGSDPIGYIRFNDRVIPETVWVTDLVVARDMRMHGYARKMIGAVESWARQKGLRRAMIESQTKNYPAIRMIQKLGYEFCGYNDMYYPSRDVAIFFSRIL